MKPGLKKSQSLVTQKPDIFVYHDYRTYLKDRVEYEKNIRPRFSLRMLASEAQLAPGYLPMVLAGSRGISSEVLSKIATILKLTKEEQKFLQGLRTIAESPSQELRLEALEDLQRHRSYRDQNPKELVVHQYLTRWFNVVIREMVQLDGFELDPKWIREKLRVKVPIPEIERALTFLLEQGFIEKQPQNKARVLQRKLECTGNVYRLVLSQFHREMLKLASDALDAVPVDERSITGLTFSIPAERYQEIFKLLDETLDRIDKISTEAKGSDSVYHVGISFFPLTQRKKR